MHVLSPALAAAVWLVLTGGHATALEHTEPVASEPAVVSAEAGEQTVTADRASFVPLERAQAVSAAPPEAPAPVATAPVVPPTAPPAVTLLLKANLAAQNVTVIEGGQVLHVWLISSGRSGYATPTGTFRPAWMAKMWRSKQYDDAPMPHSVFFNKGIAFHATSAVSMLGRPASHGCLRLAPAHAAQLYALVRKHGLLKTKVVVDGTPSFQAPAVARRAVPARKREIAARPRRVGQPVAAAQWMFAQ